MPQKVRIALDAMGGDHGAAVVVPGAELSLTRHSDIEFLLFGDRAAIEPLLATRPALKAASRLIHTDVAIKMDDKPSQALRKGRWKSSMWLAIDAVKKHEADVIISAGNTGALMAMAMVLSSNLAIAMSAPVLPAEMITSASCFLTASMASHIEDFQRPLRKAWLGLSSILMATSVWIRREAALSAGRVASNGSIAARSPNSKNSISEWRVSDSSAPGTTTAAP